MTRTLKIIIGLGAILILVGFTGNFYGRDAVSVRASDNLIVSNISNSNMMNRMMGRSINEATGEKMALDALKDKVADYISQYDESLEIRDIIEFDESDYYVSIIEKDTGLGAMELLVSPYTGEVYTEFGPNMMWNQKYGMHSGGRAYGRMGRYGSSRRGMMGNGYSATNSSTINNSVTLEEAVEIARETIKDQDVEGYVVSDDGLQFYGYYTFYMEKNDAVIGMLSVNGVTGEVWYHY